MRQLWAPWRMDYIEGIDKKSECFICEAIKEGPKAENLLLYVGVKALVIMNRFPYNPGHLMVAPIRHIGDFSSLDVEERLELMNLIDSSLRVLRKSMNPHGFNIGINIGKSAGAGLEDHLHIHIVPRWNGDTNFMPVLADVKVIPEHLVRTYEKLRKIFEEEL
ncbi:MAG: HIT family protein [Thermosulfidibacteraceae bacterium]|jgi:ATP adenylyltransferase